MGRKGNNKSVKKDVKNEVIVKNLPVKKRNEVTQLVDKLLRISTIPSPQIIPKMVKLQEEIDGIVTKIINLEVGIDVVPSVDRTSGALLVKFENWLRENGAKFDGITIKKYPGFELGLETDRDVKEGSLIISVPRKLMMSTDAAKNSIIGSLLEKDTMLQNMPNIALAMFLLVEKFLPGSFWKPYIDILPATYTTVLYFTKDELLEFKESPTFPAALNLIKSIVRQYAYLNKLIQTFEHPAAELLRNVFTYEQYRWAVSTIMTRLNNIPSEDGTTMINSLIPLWDLCNHTNGNISTEYNPDTKASECLAVKDFKKGDQLFIFYGVRTNADLFLHNGFVYEENTHDGYWLKLGLSKSDPLYEKRSILMNKITIAAHGEFWLQPGAEPISGQLLGFMRVFNMNEEQIGHWLASDKAEDLLYHDCALDTDLENKTWSFLQMRLKLILATYRSSLQDDEKILNDNKITANRRLAIQMRLSEKRILQGALNYVEQRIKT